jgi:membrane associated rhomboid family serine protease
MMPGNEIAEPISIIMNYVLIGLLFGALGIFGWFAIVTRNLRSFQFQLSVFLFIWIFGELISILFDRTITILPGFQNIAMEIHLVAMIFFCVMLWLRFYTARNQGRKMIEDPEEYSESR